MSKLRSSPCLELRKALLIDQFEQIHSTPRELCGKSRYFRLHARDRFYALDYSCLFRLTPLSVFARNLVADQRVARVYTRHLVKGYVRYLALGVSWTVRSPLKELHCGALSLMSRLKASLPTALFPRLIVDS